MTSKYISVASVLYDVSLTLDDRYYNEAKMTEWAHKAARLLRSDQMLEGKLALLEVTSHKAELPEDLIYLTQIAYNEGLSCTSTSECFPELNLPSDLDIYSSAYAINWKPLRLTTNPYHTSICLDVNDFACASCQHEFSVSSNLVVTTTLQSGAILVSYLGLPKDSDGCLLIPDNEEVKEAILHYILYRHWMSRYSMMEDGAEKRMNHHLSMWSTLSKKAAGNLNLPDTSEMENLMQQFNRLVPKQNRFEHMFMTLGNREQLDF